MRVSDFAASHGITPGCLAHHMGLAGMKVTPASAWPAMLGVEEPLLVRTLIAACKDNTPPRPKNGRSGPRKGKVAP